MRIFKKFKNRIFHILSIRMVYSGYILNSAMRWKRAVLSNIFKNHERNIFYRIRSLMWGFTPKQREKLNINSKNRKEILSYKKYLYLSGSNGKYSKWLADIITTDQIFKRFRNYMPKLYYHLYTRDGELKVISLQSELDNTREGIMNFIKNQKEVLLMYSNRTKKYNVSYKDDKLFINSKEVSDEEFFEFINAKLKHTRSLVIEEKVNVCNDFYIYDKPAKMFLKIYNKDGITPEIGEVYCATKREYVVNNDYTYEGQENTDNSLEADKSEDEVYVKNECEYKVYYDEKDGSFKSLYKRENNIVEINTEIEKIESLNRIIKDNFSEIKKIITELFKTVPQIELAGVEISICNDGFKILNIYNNPPYCSYIYFNKDFDEFLRYKYEQKRKLYKQFKFKFSVFKKKVYLKACRVFAKMFFPKGLVPYISFRWLKDMKDDFVENKKIPIRTKLWAYRHGFLSYRLAQYGITKENYKNYITDFEYKWLRHINNYYKLWFEDKVTIKYVASEFKQFFPEYYYFISLRQGENKIVPLMDCPSDLGDTYDDIFKLLEREKDLALKRDKGSHGEGFYRLSYKDNKIYLNLQEATKQDVIDILSDKSNEYLITEYIKQHEVLNKIYDGSVNTIRIIAYKKDGIHTTIGNTYMRFGSKKTGAVDNIGAGGMFVEIDKETGRFHDALIITDDRKIVPCKEHPDTHVPIEGYIPNWDKIIKDIEAIAASLEQIEYFGFDIAVTEDGMKFPEINRYPDYMKIGKLRRESIEYLLGKLECKKRKYGYDKKKIHKLFKPIDRSEMINKESEQK